MGGTGRGWAGSPHSLQRCLSCSRPRSSTRICSRSVLAVSLQGLRRPGGLEATVRCGLWRCGGRPGAAPEGERQGLGGQWPRHPTSWGRCCARAPGLFLPLPGTGAAAAGGPEAAGDERGPLRPRCCPLPSPSSPSSSLQVERVSLHPSRRPRQTFTSACLPRPAQGCPVAAAGDLPLEDPEISVRGSRKGRVRQGREGHSQASQRAPSASGAGPQCRGRAAGPTWLCREAQGVLSKGPWRSPLPLSAGGGAQSPQRSGQPSPTSRSLSQPSSAWP